MKNQFIHALSWTTETFQRHVPQLPSQVCPYANLEFICAYNYFFASLKCQQKLSYGIKNNVKTA